MSSIETSQIIDSEKFSRISDYVFAEFTSIENFEKNFKYEDVTVLEKKSTKDINYIWYINNKLEIRNSSIVFCQTDLVEHFFSILKNIDNLENIILVTHQSDKKITKKLFKLKPSLISKWFSTNVCYNHEDLVPIPIGINNSYYKMHPNSSDIARVNHKTGNEKINKVYANFNINTKQFHRFHTFKIALNSDSFVTQEAKLRKEDYLDELSKYKYVLCPWGNGYDTHRFWESIYLGSVPIIKYNKFYKHITNIPSVVVNSFKNLDIENIKVNLNKIDIDKISFSYWSELIMNEKKESDVNNLKCIDINYENNIYKNKSTSKQRFYIKRKKFKNIIFKIYKKFFII